MNKKGRRKPSNQIVGNAGLYYVCYELSKRGWNVLPTSRNTKGIDIIIFSEKAKRMHTIQVKSLSKKDPVPLGSSLENLFGEFLIICRKVFNEKPEIFIAKIDKLKNNGLIHEGVKNNKKSYWLQPKEYEKFKDNWDIIGEGYD